MSRYIDADKLKQDLGAWAINLHKPTNLVREDTFVIIDEQPAADVVEVRHGHWVYEHYDDYGHDYIREKCSLCGQVGSYNYIYCPYCGARMDRKEQEDE